MLRPASLRMSLQSQEGGDAEGGGEGLLSPLSRRWVAGAVGGVLLSGPAERVGAFCPPNCRPDQDGPNDPPAIEALTKRIDLDKGGSAREVKERTRVTSLSQLNDPDAVDLSNAETFEKTKETDRIFFDIQVGKSTNTSRIEVALYGGIVPETCKNFKMLATGEKGYGYKGTNIFRIVEGLQISGGDVNNDGGKTGKSALTGDSFEPENYKLLHTVPYIVSMANSLDKQVDSRFFISTRPEVDPGYSKIFDGKYVAFGRIVKGQDVVRALDVLETTTGIFNKGVKAGRPKNPVVIVDCGVVPK